MQLPKTIRLGLLALAEAEMARRAPDFVIGPRDQPYLLRWHLAKSETAASIYIHRILRSDDDRALHDHRGDNVSIILRGGYREVTPRLCAIPGSPELARDTREDYRQAGSVLSRRAAAAHRLVLEPGEEAVTLFITAPTCRAWGFWCPQGWTPWQDFVAKDDPGAVGPGCGA
jgi:hypothetical protein